MPRVVFDIASHRAALERAGLASVDAFRSAAGEFVKNHHGIRDIVRLTLAGDDGNPIAVYLKRNLKPIRKHARRALMRHGRYLSSAELEWRNLHRLRAIGVGTCAPVAVGAMFNLGGEVFSFIATEAAAGVELEQLARTEQDWRARRKISRAVAAMLRKVHGARIGLPTLFGRHVYVAGDPRGAGELAVSLIDLDRIARPLIFRWRRARDLAQLHLSIPKSTVSVRERLRFLRDCTGTLDRAEVLRIARMTRYLERKKFNLAATYHERALRH